MIYFQLTQSIEELGRFGETHDLTRDSTPKRVQIRTTSILERPPLKPAQPVFLGVLGSRRFERA